MNERDCQGTHKFKKPKISVKTGLALELKMTLNYYGVFVLH